MLRGNDTCKVSLNLGFAGKPNRGGAADWAEVFTTDMFEE